MEEEGMVGLPYVIQKPLENNTGMMVREIQSTMKDRDLWQQCVCKGFE